MCHKNLGVCCIKAVSIFTLSHCLSFVVILWLSDHILGAPKRYFGQSLLWELMASIERMIGCARVINKTTQLYIHSSKSFY